MALWQGAGAVSILVDERSTTLDTKFRLRQIDRLTMHTDEQAVPAFHAESGTLWVECLAIWTTHICPVVSQGKQASTTRPIMSSAVLYNIVGRRDLAFFV
jgi:hypothetical protein